MNTLKTFGSAKNKANTDIISIPKYLDTNTINQKICLLNFFVVYKSRLEYICINSL